jgi:hypothetical protein
MANLNLDPRIVSVSLQINGVTKTYSSPLNIKATGTKFANALQNEANITLFNLDKATQDYLLSETTPFNLSTSPKTLTLKAGRDSYGTAVIYVGNIVSSSVTQPPDISIILKCMTGNFLKGNVLASSIGSSASLQTIGQQVAQQLGLGYLYQASDMTVNNYNFTGSAPKQLQLINSLGGVNAFVDDNTLYIKNSLIPLTGTTRVLNASSGMVGIPEFTEQGLRVTYLLDNKTSIGGGLNIESTIYPSINGNYVIYKLGFNITTRDVPFYYIAECARISGK